MAPPRDLTPVLQSGMCIACGACVAADPTLSLRRNPVRLMIEPSGSGGPEAASVCPAMQVDFAGLQAELFPQTLPGPHGVVRSVWLAQSTDEQRNLRASSGGLIKELLRHYLAQPGIDGAIALAHEEGLRFAPKLIRQPDEVDQLPGSIYHNLPLDGALRLLRENEGRFVLVAIPCQLEGIYSYVFQREPALRSRIATTIGLICGWNYSLHALKAVCEFKGLDFERISAISYRGAGPVGKLRIVTPEKTAEIHRRVDFDYQVAFDRSFNIPRCHVCINHTNFLADIVVGDAWLPSTVMTRTGVSIVIARTAGAEGALKALEERGAIRLAPTTKHDISESQSRRIALGEFAYAYADYRREIGEHTPEMTGPNRPHARLAPRKEAERFHRQAEIKLRLQREGRYKALRRRKATIELGPFLMRYVRWFFVRVLKVKRWFGGAQAPAQPARMNEFR